ncbi:MAG TPA: PVC-type heme-binding CxxCH protein [Lacipirellulaceae bacterium]|nr:PVC-type heme-binding CxxCH protein [Lacipirellulaceae bacterium]
MRKRKSLSAFVILATVCVAALGADKATKRSTPKPGEPEPGSDIKLERVPPKTPQQSHDATEVLPGFRMDLVASEPNIASPVAIAFDGSNKIYVVEMIDYSEKDKEHLGRIRLLTDEDGDGVYETSKVFVDNLSWPTAVICYDGGIFVGDAPDILYFKDTDGDGKADVRKVVYTGFGRKNVQGLLNTFLWGLDHKIYGQTSSSGGKITRPDKPGEPLDLSGRDFRFDPKTLEIEAITGGGQHGMSFNRWGDRFVCQNSDHLQAIVFEEKYVARNPYQSVISARRSIASDGPQAEVYRISPVEAWREARTKLRVSGAVPGPIEGGGRAAGYFTGSTGVTIYEGGLWPNNDDAIALVADVGSNLIHRKRLAQEGVTYRGDRIDKDTEFIRSKDIWFRPVQMTIGPEGALYVMDMYREVIEHPSSLPAVLKRQLDLSSGQDMGRLYRVVPEGYKYKRPPMLDKASTEELAATLDDANQWRRMTAMRLIYEKQDASAGKALHAQLPNTKRPEGRICVLYALDSVGALEDADLLKALGDEHPQVRRHAIRLSEARLDKSPELLGKVASLVSDSDPVVQFQLALSLGESRDAKVAPTLAHILLHNTDRDITDAALTSIVDRAGPVLALLLGSDKWATSRTAESVIKSIVGQIARQRRPEDLDALVALLQSPEGDQHAANKAALLKALSRLPSDALSGDTPAQLVKLRDLRQTAAKKLVAQAEEVLHQPNAKTEDRVAAIANLSLDKFEQQQAEFGKLWSSQESPEIRAAVLAACGQYESAGVPKLVLSQWSKLSQAEKSQVADLLLRRGAWALALAEYLQKQNERITVLEPAQVSKLQNYPDPKVRAIVKKLGGQGMSEDRQKVFKDYHDEALAGGDATKGKAVFEKNCSTCHEVASIGHAVGPNLAAMVNRGAEAVLYNVIAPNAEVDPRFMEYVVLTGDGQVLSGVIAGETSTAVTLRGPENKTTTILRVDIDDIHTTGKSLMPEGFEKTIDKKSMADLITFLQQAAGSKGAKK